MTSATPRSQKRRSSPLRPKVGALLALRHNLRAPKQELRERFVVFSQSRCGSSLLAELLDAHPEVHCATEIFRLSPPFPNAYRRAVERLSPAPVFGFKLQVHHLDNELGLDDRQAEAFVVGLVEAGYRFIYLKRENSLRQVISDRLREAGGPTYLRSSGPHVIDPLTVDVKAVLDRLKTRQHYWDVAERLLVHTDHVHVGYEADLQESGKHQATADRLFSFLGLQSAPVSTSTRRINTRTLSELVENYAELQAALADTPWAAQLEQPSGGDGANEGAART